MYLYVCDAYFGWHPDLSGNTRGNECLCIPQHPCWWVASADLGLLRSQVKKNAISGKITCRRLHASSVRGSNAHFFQFSASLFLFLFANDQFSQDANQSIERLLPSCHTDFCNAFLGCNFSFFESKQIRQDPGESTMWDKGSQFVVLSRNIGSCWCQLSSWEFHSVLTHHTKDRAASPAARHGY